MHDINSERFALVKMSAIFAQPEINTDGHNFFGRNNPRTVWTEKYGQLAIRRI